jgi:16S rRNA (guanine(966)-N(2))-methyltransferase RsmD
LYALVLEQVEMRVIAGKFRSRLLSAPQGMKTRPTSDRLRETLFNVIASRIEEARFLDLYAGSGAVGVEAISRGAKFVWFAESAAVAVKAIRENLAALKIDGGYRIQQGSAAALLEGLLKKNERVDLVFLDPPYEAEEEYERTLAFLGNRGAVLLDEDARVVAEHRNKTELAERYGALKRVRVLKQGDAALTFFAIDPEVETDGESAAPQE